MTGEVAQGGAVSELTVRVRSGKRAPWNTARLRRTERRVMGQQEMAGENRERRDVANRVAGVRNARRVRDQIPDVGF